MNKKLKGTAGVPSGCEPLPGLRAPLPAPPELAEPRLPALPKGQEGGGSPQLWGKGREGSLPGPCQFEILSPKGPVTCLTGGVGQCDGAKMVLQVNWPPAMQDFEGHSQHLDLDPEGDQHPMQLT